MPKHHELDVAHHSNAREERDDDSDKEDNVAAYSRLLNGLKVGLIDKASHKGTAHKRRKVDFQNKADGKDQSGKNSISELVTSSKSRRSDVSPSSGRDLGKQNFKSISDRKQKATGKDGAEYQKEEATEAAGSTRRHLERLLNAEDLAAPRHDKDLTVMEDVRFSEDGASWSQSGEPVEVLPSLQAYGVRTKLQGLWREVNRVKAEEKQDFKNTKQSAFFAIARSYKDILYPAYPYPASFLEEDEVMDAVLLHCLDHIAAGAQTIKKHNEALKADPSLENPRDQGFSRPKVLILLPMRNTAHKVVSRLLSLAQKETRSDSIQGKARFEEDYGPQDEDKEEEAKIKHHNEEHKVLFHGNTDDHFRLGIKLTRGAVKLYADFFQSDIIVASPIALATKQAEVDGKTDEDLDFLSSIEITVAARCDVMQMQNWSHVRTVFDALNKLPKDLHGADVMRVREWYLQGQAKHYRQNILLSSFCSPELRALFNSQCHSHSGMARLQPHYKGVLGKAGLQIHQVFEKFSAHSVVDDIDKRFEHFKSRIWPRLRDSGSAGQMVFVPSYLDYVRLRSFLRAEEFEFEGFSEYASGSEVARGRSRFAAGKVRLALYTERAHFYHRRNTKGVKDLYFYQLPEHAQFYNELVALLAFGDGADAAHSTVTVMVSKTDALRLERVVGSRNARSMLKAASKTFMFSQA